MDNGRLDVSKDVAGDKSNVKNAIEKTADVKDLEDDLKASLMISGKPEEKVKKRKKVNKYRYRGLSHVPRPELSGVANGIGSVPQSSFTDGKTLGSYEKCCLDDSTVFCSEEDAAGNVKDGSPGSMVRNLMLSFNGGKRNRQAYESLFMQHVLNWPSLEGLYVSQFAWGAEIFMRFLTSLLKAEEKLNLKRVSLGAGGYLKFEDFIALLDAAAGQQNVKCPPPLDFLHLPSVASCSEEQQTRICEALNLIAKQVKIEFKTYDHTVFN